MRPNRGNLLGGKRPEFPGLPGLTRSRINPRPPVKPATLGALARFEMLFSENKDHPNPDAGAAPARGEEP